MKKLLGVALMLALCASSAFAVNSPTRVQGLRFGNWGVNGFEFSADTTFLNGAVVGTANVDTTEAFNLTNVDWGMNTLAPRSNAVNIMRLWVSGEFISCDSVKVALSISYDKQTWFTTGTPISAGLQTQGNQTAFSVPFTMIAQSAGFITAIPSSVGGIPAVPYVRFIITADGNTAARMAATTAKVVYSDIRDNPVEQPKLVCQQLKFGTHFPSGFVASKDTASITFAAPDTTEALNLTDWNFGPSGQIAAVADSGLSFATLAGVSLNPSSNDSVYVLQEVSADGNHWARPQLIGDASLYGRYSGVVTSNVPTDLATGATFQGFCLNVGQSHPTLGNRTNAMNFAPFVRFIIRGGSAGAVMGSGKYWISYWRIPRK